VQQRLRDAVRLEPLGQVQLVLGLDCAFSGDRVLAMGVVWDLAKQRVQETRAASAPLTFPYVPGLLSFREIPALLRVIRSVQSAVDVLLCDGQGIAHPRRFGVASHLGVITGLPSVGCAKSRLTGRAGTPADAVGSVAPLLAESAAGGEPAEAERIGTVVRTRKGVKPVFVSPGHRCTHEDAVRLVLDCTAGYRLPEPVRLADRLVARFKREGRYRGGVVGFEGTPDCTD